MIKMSQECDFDACDQPVCDAEKGITGAGFRFCQEHRDEFRRYVIGGDVRKMLGFWVRAEGGADRLAKKMAPHVAIGASRIVSYLKRGTEEET